MKKITPSNLSDTNPDELIQDTIAPNLALDDEMLILTEIIEESHTDSLPILTEVITPNAIFDTETLQTEIQENVLRALQSRIDILIDDRFNTVMHGLLTQLTLTFAEDLKTSVNEHLSDIIKRAISQELTKTLSQKNKTKK